MTGSGLLIGDATTSDGTTAFRELPWRGEGLWRSRVSHYTWRQTLYSDAAGAWLEFRLPQGLWRLMLTQHEWSGQVLVCNADHYEIIDLYADGAASGILEVPIESQGEASPVRIEVTGMRNPAARGQEVWLLGVRSGCGSFHPEVGTPCGAQCRMIDADHGRFLALRTDTGLADQLASAGTWEPENAAVFDRHARESRIVLDIGANIGYHSVALARLRHDRGQVHAFEPQAPLFNLLAANLVLNGCSQVVPHRQCLGVATATLRVQPIDYRSFGNFGAMSLQRASAGQRAEAVSVVALDAFLATQRIAVHEVGFIRIDVHAQGIAVLEGALELLRVARPVLYLEVSPRRMRGAGHDYTALYRMLEELGYGLQGTDLLPHVDPGWDGESFGTWKLVAIPARAAQPVTLIAAAAPLDEAEAPLAEPPRFCRQRRVPLLETPAPVPDADDAFALPPQLSALPRFASAEPLRIDEAEAGAWAFILRDPALLRKVAAWFGRPSAAGLVIKAWQYPHQGDDLHRVHWGRYFDLTDAPFLEVRRDAGLLPALKAQNFVAMAGRLAPRVHGLFLVESPCGTLHPAILTEDSAALRQEAEPPLPEDLYDRIAGFCAEHGINPPFGDLATPGNLEDGIWVDWQYAWPGERHVAFLREHYLRHTQFGDSKYQTAPAVGVGDGIRDSVRRIGDLGLNRLDFGGRTVLDIGCNGGQFLNYAAARGARYGCGVDWPETARAAAYVSNHLGHFNLDYLGAPLHEGFPSGQTGVAEFDIVLFLSMVTHIGVPDWLHGLGRILVVEINHAHQVEETLASLTPHWWPRFIGKAGDHGNRAIYHCFSRRHFAEPPA